MKALTKVLAGAAVMATGLVAAPAAAQYYPYGPSGTPMMGNAPGYGYGYGGYNSMQGPMVSQCTAAVQDRLNRSQAYGYNSGGRVLGVSRVDPRDDGGFTVRGVAASGAYGYNQQPDLTFRCRTDFRGYVVDLNIQPAQRTYSPYGNAPYGYANPPYGQVPYNTTGPYGYSRY